MPTFDVTIVTIITIAFIGFEAALVWGWAQTKGLPKPVPWDVP